MQLEGHTVLLTGATGGLGRAIAHALAERGTTMVLSSRRADELERLAADLGGKAHRTLVTDLAEEGAGERLAEEAGDVDVFIANAALPGTGRISERTVDEITRVLRVNLENVIRTTHALLPAMLERGSGHFVYISSLAGKTPSPRSAMYNASKFGLRGFALAFRQDLRGSGVGASLVLPGFIRDAGMFADAEVDPPPGFGTSSPQEVGAAVVKAIEADKAELVVAPPQQRALTAVGQAFPGIAAAMQRGRGEQVADDLAAGQADKK